MRISGENVRHSDMTSIFRLLRMISMKSAWLIGREILYHPLMHRRALRDKTTEIQTHRQNIRRMEAIDLGWNLASNKKRAIKGMRKNPIIRAKRKWLVSLLFKDIGSGLFQAFPNVSLFCLEIIYGDYLLYFLAQYGLPAIEPQEQG